jgi:hypothetical protein
MEVKINKEIRDYTESMYFGLSMRQFLFAAGGVAAAAGAYFLLRGAVPKEALSWVCILAASPFGLMGFFKYNGMTAERFAVAVVKSEILIPKRLLFRGKSLYHELLAQPKPRRKPHRSGKRKGGGR